MKKQNKGLGTTQKQASNRNVTAFSKEGVSISMRNKRKSVEMRVRGFKQSYNGL